MLIGYWWESQKGRDHWGDQDVGGWTIKIDLSDIGWDGVDWIDMSQDREYGIEPSGLHEILGSS
jgi:hypothetical protein